jgi:hypothetical protein
MSCKLDRFPASVCVCVVGSSDVKGAAGSPILFKLYRIFNTLLASSVKEVPPLFHIITID